MPPPPPPGSATGWGQCGVGRASVCVGCVAKAARPCDVDGKTYKDGEEFKPNCSLLCTCQNGAYACASLCPQEDRAPSSTHCRDAQLVSIVGQCCREWVCPHAHSIAEPDQHATDTGTNQPTHSPPPSTAFTPMR